MDEVVPSNEGEADSQKVVRTQKRKRRYRITFDPKSYLVKKTMIQALLDTVLLTTNASQLKYLLLFAEQHEFYAVTMNLIKICITFQALSGLLILIVMVLGFSNRKHQKIMKHLNEIITIGLSLGVVFHIIGASFSIKIQEDFYRRSETTHFEDKEKNRERNLTTLSSIWKRK